MHFWRRTSFGDPAWEHVKGENRSHYGFRSRLMSVRPMLRSSAKAAVRESDKRKKGAQDTIHRSPILGQVQSQVMMLI